MATSPPPPSASTREQAGPRPGVLLVAHGSAHSGASAEPVLGLARALARRGFPEVRTAFWKEETFLHQALDAARSPFVVVLPVFLAEGYFSRVVVPRELGLAYGDNTLGSRMVRLLPPLGADPALDALVLDRARSALPHPARPADCGLVVLGHGTERDPGSADAVRAVCARLGAGAEFARVTPAFLDQEPSLAQVIAGERAGHRAVVVPFLVASGFHGSELQRSVDRDGREVIVAEPIGTHPGLVDVVERRLLTAAVSELPTLGASDAALGALEPALAERLARARALALLQVEIRALGGDDGFALRHVDDRGADEAELDELATPDALIGRARRDAHGRHRPLRTAADLQRGWRHHARDVRALVEALVALYGPALTHWWLGEGGALATREFADVAARQTGIYAELTQVEPAAVAEGVRRVCDGLPCLRARLWGPRTARAVENAQGAGLVVPCPAPCPVLLGAVLELPPE